MAGSGSTLLGNPEPSSLPQNLSVEEIKRRIEICNDEAGRHELAGNLSEALINVRNARILNEQLKRYSHPFPLFLVCFSPSF